MFRLAIPLALLVGIGLAARLTSQENLAPESEPATEPAVESALDVNGPALEFVWAEEEIRNAVNQAQQPDPKPERRDVDVELEFMLSQAESGDDRNDSAPAGVAAEPGAATDGRMIRIYRLEHAEASAIAEMIDRFFQDVVGLVAHADARTNSLIVRATPPHQEQIAALLEALDKAPPQEGQGRRMRLRVNPPGFPVPPGPPVEVRRRARYTAEAAPRVEDEDEIVVERLPADRVPLLTPPSADRDVLIWNNRPDIVARVVPLEPDQHELAVLAERIRGLRAAMPQDEATIADLQAQLRERVVAAFEARQAAQRAELAVLEQQLQSIKQEIEKRDQQKEDLVKQRVEQWLSGKQLQAR